MAGGPQAQYQPRNPLLEGIDSSIGVGMGLLAVRDMDLLFVKEIVTRRLCLSLDLIWNIAVVVVVLVSLF